MSHSVPPTPGFYEVLLTPEDEPTAKPMRVWLCEHHYIMAANCLMIRRVLNTWVEAECKFCS